MRSGGPTTEDNRTRACIQACMMRKEGALVDGKVDTDVACELFKRLPGDLQEKACQYAKECAPEVEGIEDDCDIAEKFRECFVQKMPKDLNRMRGRFHPHEMPNEDSLQGNQIANNDDHNIEETLQNDSLVNRSSQLLFMVGSPCPIVV